MNQPIPIPPGSAGRAAFLIHSLAGGGVQRVTLNIARYLAERGYAIDLVALQGDGFFADQIPEGVRLVTIPASPWWRWRLAAIQAWPAGFWLLARPLLLAKPDWPVRHLPHLIRYFAREKPDVVFSAALFVNIIAVLARRRARFPRRLILSERNAISPMLRRRRPKWRFLAPVVDALYRQADQIVTVSDSVADDLTTITTIPRTSMRTIYNPLITADIPALAAQVPDHPWFADHTKPVILAAGRLARQKSYDVLLRAFAIVRNQLDCRLVILGEGPERARLDALIDQLDLRAHVDMPGFAADIFAYMGHADLFVLSSHYEGLPGTLIQAMACGCPVVSTDCPGGSREILDNGRYGPLVPVGDHVALAAAIIQTINVSGRSELLKARAQDFAVEARMGDYLTLLFGPSAGAQEPMNAEADLARHTVAS